ncbi:MAG: phosphate ABC transporter substrate-binding protein [Bacteroidia bacterium]|nr:phosphate ABC transporter substrate-binding protein [Bacteroidia bacterium]
MNDRVNIIFKPTCFIFIFALLWACNPDEDYIKLKGSDTVLPIAQKEAEVYLAQHPDASITVTGGGSGVGIAALIDGTTHIAMASREIKIAEELRLQNTDQEVRETIVAYDALAVVVHPDNPMEQITRKQLEYIYSGKVKNWKEIGGPDMTLVSYARETSSGTYEYFKEVVLENREYAPSVLSLNSNGAILQSVSQTPGAIGYVGLAYLNDQIKALSVSFNEKDNFVAPTVENSKKKTYPISRPLYFYYLDQTRERIEPFLSFILSDKGQQIIKNLGYVPIN